MTEIREYGSTPIQVMRRLRAMLEELRYEVHAEHRPAVEEELARLQTTVTRAFADSVDLDRGAAAGEQRQPAEQPSHQKVEETEEHDCRG